jgi:hypothetical protein
MVEAHIQFYRQEKNNEMRKSAIRSASEWKRSDSFPHAAVAPQGRAELKEKGTWTKQKPGEVLQPCWIRPWPQALSEGRWQGPKSQPQSYGKRDSSQLPSHGEGKGKGKPHSDTCFFYNLGLRGLPPSCNRPDCGRNHVRIPDADFAKMRKTDRARSASPATSSSSGGSSTGKGKQRRKTPKGKDTNHKKVILHCHQFVKDGSCKVEKDGGKCKYPRMTKAQLAKARADAEVE